MLLSTNFPLLYCWHAPQLEMLPGTSHRRHGFAVPHGLPAYLKKLANARTMNFEIAAYHMLEMLRNPDKV